MKREFHTKFDLAYNGQPRLLPDSGDSNCLQTLRLNRLNEELMEYLSARTREDQLDALVDLAYIAYGTAELHGLNYGLLLEALYDDNTVAMPEYPLEDVTKAFRTLHYLMISYRSGIQHSEL